ncbi:tyrosine-protein kinase STYK1-like [Oncorhynchus kisutch]|uniref:Serine/threonine/tyrosine kinase 1a n=1 Tax=Oncorhynchus kisutch TaxID=8019 RepID=A0A8C7G2C1_ONCKI|nr:tyrosine-protein kinase STYK1-like [Oncorhynchus kisutch]
MSSYSDADNQCQPGNTICEITVYEQEVIIVPVLLLASFLVSLLIVLLLRYCTGKENRRRPTVTLARPHSTSTASRHTQRKSTRRNTQGIEAPPELNPLEHEELPMGTPTRHDALATLSAVPETPKERQHGSFNLVTPLPLSFPVKPDDSVTLYRARMDNRDVVLRTLKEKADDSERQSFLGFASFLSELGPHPFLPGLMGVVSLRTPLITVMEELVHRDLLGFLWRCRQDTGVESPCDITEQRIFTMGGQVASALAYLHGQSCIHGNVGARSVLVGLDLTAKLWGLGPAYCKKTQAGTPGELQNIEMRKWQAPEVLARRPVSQSSDVWSFGILLHEIVTLGDPPFPKVMAGDLLQYLQRGKTQKRPANCSNSLYSIIKSCGQFAPHERPTLAEVIQKLQSGEKSANNRTVLRVPEPLDIEKYLREAGYGEAYNYVVL